MINMNRFVPPAKRRKLNDNELQNDDNISTPDLSLLSPPADEFKNNGDEDGDIKMNDIKDLSSFNTSVSVI